MYSKAQVIDGILQINPTASADWLARFELSALTRYLDHLQQTIEPRGRESFWHRDGETSAVVTRHARA